MQKTHFLPLLQCGFSLHVPKDIDCAFDHDVIMLININFLPTVMLVEARYTHQVLRNNELYRKLTDIISSFYYLLKSIVCRMIILQIMPSNIVFIFHIFSFFIVRLDWWRK